MEAAKKKQAEEEEDRARKAADMAENMESNRDAKVDLAALNVADEVDIDDI